MRITNRLKHLICLILVVFSAPAAAEIVITPNSPFAEENVRIELINQFTSASTISNATITKTGNTFEINQTVDISCFLPSGSVAIPIGGWFWSLVIISLLVFFGARRLRAWNVR